MKTHESECEIWHKFAVPVVQTVPEQHRKTLWSRSSYTMIGVWLVQWIIDPLLFLNVSNLRAHMEIATKKEDPAKTIVPWKIQLTTVVCGCGEKTFSTSFISNFDICFFHYFSNLCFEIGCMDAWIWYRRAHVYWIWAGACTGNDERNCHRKNREWNEMKCEWTNTMSEKRKSWNGNCCMKYDDDEVEIKKSSLRLPHALVRTEIAAKRSAAKANF